MNLSIESKLSWVLTLVAVAACSDTTRGMVETETHFLESCESSCEDGLSCICGVCTKACTDDDACEALASGARCAANPSACGDTGSLCDVACEAPSDCAALGAGYTCAAGRCRAESDAGSGGSGGAGAGGDGASGDGGEGGGSGNGGQGGAADDGGTVDAAIDSGSDAGADASNSGPCDAVGDTCCDPFPGDGPNYCNGARLTCGANNSCIVNCDCVLGAYIPVCGVDGQSYDATCGNACVPVEIACSGECPCEAGFCTVACTGAAPDQEVVDACQAISDQATCQTYESGGFPTDCRWVTPSTASCPPFP